jgi:hypothetical protein
MFPAIFVSSRSGRCYASGQLNKALKLLTSASSPRMRELELLKGQNLL